MVHKLSIAIISSQCGKTPSDTAYPYVFDEAYILAKKGVEVHVVRSQREKYSTSYGIHFHGIGEYNTYYTLKLFAETFHCYPFVSLVRRPTKLYWEYIYALSVSKVVEKYDIDVIHAHFAYPEGWVGFLCKAKLRTKIPFIITSHGKDLNILPEHKYGIRLNPRYNLMVKKVCRNADHIIVPSKLLFLRAVEAGANPQKVTLLPNAVNLEMFNPKNIDGHLFREKYKLGDSKIILIIRGLRKYYGIESIIRIASKIPDKLNLKFIIIGRGKPYSDLLSNAGDMLGRKIMLLGNIPHDEIPFALAAADVVIDPSPLGQGINTLEAMAMEKPVIGIRSRSWDYIVDGYSGFLVSSDDEMLKKNAISD
jgi:glycosyltransferase involved in cell wall biosynthesis